MFSIHLSDTMYSRLLFLVATASISLASRSTVGIPKETDWVKTAAGGLDYGMGFIGRKLRGGIDWIGSTASSMGSAAIYSVNPSTLPLSALKPKDMVVRLQARIADSQSYLDFLRQNPSASLGDIDVAIAQNDIARAQDMITRIETVPKKATNLLNNEEGARKANSYTEWLVKKTLKPVVDYTSPYIDPKIKFAQKKLTDLTESAKVSANNFVDSTDWHDFMH